jgi:hypothetical protein
MSTVNNILILGFYDRKNIGDECYKKAFPILFKNNIGKITFVCTDDIDRIPDDISIVVCGGGDIINEYFMKKVQDLLKNFVGRTYAISVGIPYKSMSKYLHIFDHVFVRSTNDYNVAIKELGENNVTYYPDLSVLIKPINPILTIPFYNRYLYKMRKQNIVSLISKPISIGICLAQPYFYNNKNKILLLDTILNSIIKLYKNYNIELNFLCFNYDKNSLHECDYECNQYLIEELDKLNIPYNIRYDIIDPYDMINFINGSIDISICMRYHSVMFSALTNTRFVALYSSSKIHNLLTDLNYDTRYINRMRVDENFMPIKINSDKFYNSLELACNNLVYNSNLNIDYNDIVNKVLIDKKKLNILVTDDLKSFEDVILLCVKGLSKYLNFDNQISLIEKGSLPIGDKTPLEVARYICFIVSGKTHHPCVWGLADKITNDDFNLYESLSFIWETCKVQHETIEKQHIYYPVIPNINRKVLINLDYVFQNDFAQYHRSGWSYVIGGLMNLDASHFMKNSDIMIDTYVDRSFHWGYNILKNVGMIPYTKPWYGFIHHTFDTNHSEYNCNNLLENLDFRESLKCCKGLIVLSEYLGIQLRDALDKLNIPVDIHVIYHPMEFVSNIFTLPKYLDNKKKRIVQIGAWLRNPYGIYALPLSLNKDLTKTSLKGKEMDLYFPPPDFKENLEEVLLKRKWFDRKQNSNCICRNVPPCRDMVCRDNSSINKFCEGLYHHIIDEINSVEILEKLNNEDYDKLLSENIVFLNLVDCSAVNTVLECIVRNTPLIVNRIPAIEELLGINYPGFYTSLNEAADICQDINRIYLITIYLSRLDKSRYTLEHFIDKIQEIILNGSSINNYNLYINYIDNNKKYKRLLPNKVFI